jgi:UDP-N-acetylmuramate dehydrogenase
LVSDSGIRGIVVNMTSLDQWSHHEGVLDAQAGLDVSAAAQLGYEGGFSCIEFLNAMPSTLGGAIFMNARCYGAEIADVLLEVTVLDEDNRIQIVPFEPSQWSYKRSPFQGRDWVILSAKLRTKPCEPSAIEAIMRANAADRESKGHFRLPCAGSIFKNNHAFGDPSGVIIDRLGLKGLARGQAAVSAWHANILVNNGGASAADMRSLIEEVQQRVFDATGFLLEEEVIYAGEWS